ncbi:MAG: ABC transporter permease [Acidimicrobiales bacterium]
MQILIQQLFDALTLSALYLSIALGLTLVYGLTRLINFAQGQLLVLGSFLTYALVHAGIPIGWSILIGTLAIAFIGEFLDLVLFRRTLNSPLRGFVVSLGLIIVIEQTIVLIWGPNNYSVPPPFTRIFDVDGVRFDSPSLLLLGSVLVLLIALFFVFERTKLGHGIQALSEDRTTALLMGIPVGRYISFTFLIGSALAGLGGAILATIYPFTAYSGTQLVLVAFAIAIIGGLGSIRGAAVAALLLAIPQSLASAYVSISWAPAFGLVATAIIILWRPHGLFRSTGGGGTGHFTLGSSSERLHAAEVRLSNLLKRNSLSRRTGLSFSTPRAVIWVVVVLTGLAPLLLGNGEALSTATYMVIIATASFGFWLTFKQAGIFSLAPSALMGIGGYTAAVLLSKYNWSFWLQLPLGIIAAAIVALIVGLIALRTTHSYFVILTLVLSELIILAITNLTSLTGGQLGIVASSPPSSLGPINFSGSDSFFYLAFAVMILAMIVVYVVTKINLGDRLLIIRENEQLARALGVNVLRDKVIVFTIFGGISGAAGVMLFYYLHYITPGTYDIPTTLNILLVVLLGGATVWLGPIVGAALFSFLPAVLNLSPDVSQMVYGLILVAVIISMPLGVGGALKGAYTTLRLRFVIGTSANVDAGASKTEIALGTANGE